MTWCGLDSAVLWKAEAMWLVASETAAPVVGLDTDAGVTSWDGLESKGSLSLATGALALLGYFATGLGKREGGTFWLATMLVATVLMFQLMDGKTLIRIKEAPKNQ